MSAGAAAEAAYARGQQVRVCQKGRVLPRLATVVSQSDHGGRQMVTVQPHGGVRTVLVPASDLVPAVDAEGQPLPAAEVWVAGRYPPGTYRRPVAGAR